ncbi:hypothetical protein AAFC00_005880 [Neodothiora populina]|uniref:Class II aldolase/adducin N-terminal domain-containing protein n=1 Tax=Neodothiora populina TaxID=2781224 RepID=A0ABR3P7G6_9PEZI
MAGTSQESVFSTLIAANHILHYHKVVDAFGHISVRNPANPSTFFLSGNLAPALVSGLQDLVEYRVEDAGAVREDAPRGYAERFIHSEIYKKWPEVNSVVHAHAEDVIPFSISSQPIRPVYHMAGVIGACVPVFDINNHYKPSDTTHNLLVTNSHLGVGLANAFSPTSAFAKPINMIKSYFSSSDSPPPPFPPNPTVLMRGHGFTCVGTSIQESVYRSIYLCSNARVQTNALLIQNTFNVRKLAVKSVDDVFPIDMKDITYLSDRECVDAWEANKAQAARPWKLWCKEVETSGLYSNQLGPPPGT